jgi:hypothetical protein
MAALNDAADLMKLANGDRSVGRIAMLSSIHPMVTPDSG